MWILSGFSESIISSIHSTIVAFSPKMRECVCNICLIALIFNCAMMPTISASAQTIVHFTPSTGSPESAIQNYLDLCTQLKYWRSPLIMVGLDQYEVNPDYVSGDMIVDLTSNLSTGEDRFFDANPVTFGTTVWNGMFASETVLMGYDPIPNNTFEVENMVQANPSSPTYSGVHFINTMNNLGSLVSLGSNFTLHNIIIAREPHSGYTGPPAQIVEMNGDNICLRNGIVDGGYALSRDTASLYEGTIIDIGSYNTSNVSFVDNVFMNSPVGAFIATGEYAGTILWDGNYFANMRNVAVRGSAYMDLGRKDRLREDGSPSGGNIFRVNGDQLFADFSLFPFGDQGTNPIDIAMQNNYWIIDDELILEGASHEVRVRFLPAEISGAGRANIAPDAVSVGSAIVEIVPFAEGYPADKFLPESSAVIRSGYSRYR